MFADIGTTTLRGTVQHIPVETAVHPIVKATLEINIAKAKLDPAPRHTTNPDLAGKHFTPEEHLANCGLLLDGNPVSLVALTDSFGVTMLLPTFGIYATSSFKRYVNRCLRTVFVSFFTSCLTHLGRVYHVSHVSNRLTSSYHFFTYRSFQLADRTYFDLSSRGLCVHHGVPGSDLPV